jgi:protein-S-isoprenylcysteine O-methyltransferase Ste14
MPLTIRIAIVGTLWLIFWIYWLYPRRGSKRTTGTRTWRYGIIMWATYVLFIILVFRIPGVRDVFASYGISDPAISDSIFGYVGILLCAAGVAIAIWARAYLGSNWGVPMSVKENQGLVTTGPYALVRHPIYTGMGLAILGSALFLGGLWFFVVLVFFFGFVVVSAKREEKLLTQQFPDAYPAYKKRTKALIPFVW